ncbi:glycosyltransferase family 61 protein [Hymenobacter sp. RP-2-7]|uniref:Glycosyltransferase family 61 protein n=1 Tax=Hymenobacter polaris TaxID=2682546 RepID=A0A7Y0AIQ8_9BACT|nr:glycosyltransferase family 61 protein [Hymenobacter polaris]NML68050.1 glycosyltransferase family 61 protein [Hymenobacter polaris]
MSLLMQRLVAKPIKYAADALVRGLVRVVPALKATQIYSVSLPALSPAYALPLNFGQLAKRQQDDYRNIFAPATAAVFVLNDVYVAQQGAVFKNFSLFSPTLHPGSESSFQDTFLLKQWLGKVKQLPPEEAIVALAYNQYSLINYYHWIIETLPRLLALREKYPGCALLVPEPTPEYIRVSAAIFGFTKLVGITKDAVLKVPNLLIPYATPSHWGLTYGYEEGGVINEIRREVVAALQLPEVQPHRRLYISRSRANARRLLNEEAVQTLVKQYEFEVVYFEGMSFREQVALMQQAAVVLGVHGANLTNLVFMQPGTQVIEMMSAEINNLTYYRLATYLSIGYYSVAYEIVESNTARLFADVLVDTDELATVLAMLPK